MPKKANRRPVRTKARPRQPSPRAATAAPVLDQEPVSESPNTPVTASVATPTSSAAARPVASASRRAPPAARKAPTLAVNYDYLSHDLRLLALLAVTMIVLVVASYFVFH